MQGTRGTITLYDAGGGIIILALFGLPFGILIDYIWNRLVLSQTLRYLPRRMPGTIGIEKAASKIGTYTIIITIIGLIIDWGYYELIWNVERGLRGTSVWVPLANLPGQAAMMILPLSLLLLANFWLARSYLKLGNKPAAGIGIFMGVLTAPWIVVILPYVAGWTRL